MTGDERPNGEQSDGGTNRRRSFQTFFENKAIRRREGALEGRVHWRVPKWLE
jgi:hypothetical protein